MGRKSIEPGRLSKQVAVILNHAKEEQCVGFRELEEKSGVNRLRIQRALRVEVAFYLDELDAVCSALGLVAWKVMREAEENLRPNLSVVPDTLQGPDETALAAHTGEKESDQ